MDSKFYQLYPTDKDIYDLLMSAKQKLTEGVLIDIAKKKGLFFSPSASREDLANALSMMQFDNDDIVALIERRDYPKKGEKTTFLELPVTLSRDDLKEALQAYQVQVSNVEKVTLYDRNKNDVAATFEYDEYDYSRTRLIQRQRKQADFDFINTPTGLVLRYPATEKARQIAGFVKKQIEKQTLKELKNEEIEISDLNTSEKRTLFFVGLFSRMPGYRHRTVTNIRVTSLRPESSDVDDDINEDGRSKQEIITEVESVTIRGNNIVASKQYQDLRVSGFYITAIVWRSEQIAEPRHMVEFDAAFENGPEGTGFKYGIRYSPLKKDGEYEAIFRPIESTKKSVMFALVEETARTVLTNIRNGNG